MRLDGLRVGVLTVSDRVAVGDRADLGGDALAEQVAASGGAVVARRVVPDEPASIAGALRALAEDADVVLTTGGTGLGPRDVTPEATRAVLDREAPGITEALRAASLAITPYAMLSRATAGLIGRVLVVNLPGNPKAVGEEWAVLAPVLGHAVETARGPVSDASHRHGAASTQERPHAEHVHDEQAHDEQAHDEQAHDEHGPGEHTGRSPGSPLPSAMPADGGDDDEEEPMNRADVPGTAAVDTMNLGQVHDAVRRRLEAKFAARETGLANARQAIRRCANAIRASHRGEMDRADALMDEARELLDVAEASLAAHPDVYYAGFLQDAQKEYAEARVTRSVIDGRRPPGPEDLGVGDIPYLNGLAEAVGELRRHLLDRLRAGDSARASEVFAAMDELHGMLVDIDYPDGMTAGLRRSTDVARSILERTRGDLTLTLVQRDLAHALGADRTDATASGRDGG